MRRTILTGFFLLVSAGSLPAQEPLHAHGASPYADLRDREIKALPDEEVRSLLAGEGMGFALPAELNGYPGPRHVLEWADSLGLTPEQRERTGRLMEGMLREARRLGARIVEAERALDQAFSAGAVTEPALRRATLELGELRGELRATHLAAHLVMRELLTPHQVHRYQLLRGYGADHGETH